MSDSLAQINDINLKIFDEICAERFNELDIECVLISIIDKIPSDALPHLAEQYHITGNEGWLQAVKEEEKRNLIKSSIKMHRYKGTKYAIKEIFKTLNIFGDIEEWFNYGGQPYYFKVILEILNQPLTIETEKTLRALINEYKNERSWLESIRINIKNEKSSKVSIGCVFQESLILDVKRAI